MSFNEYLLINEFEIKGKVKSFGNDFKNFLSSLVELKDKNELFNAFDMYFSLLSENNIFCQQFINNMYKLASTIIRLKFNEPILLLKGKIEIFFHENFCDERMKEHLKCSLYALKKHFQNFNFLRFILEKYTNLLLRKEESEIVQYDLLTITTLFRYLINDIKDSFFYYQAILLLKTIIL